MVSEFNVSTITVRHPIRYAGLYVTSTYTALADVVIARA